MDKIKLNKKKVFILLMILSFASYPSFSQNDNLSDYKISFILPINHTTTPKYNLIVSTPEHFQADTENILNFHANKSTTLEFIPKGQNLHNWLEIITAHKMIGNKVSAKNLLDMTLQFIQQESDSFEILEQKTSSNSFYLESKLAILYTYQDQRELLYMEYYSGPYDCVGLQYTVRLRDDITQNPKLILKHMKDNISNISYISSF